MGEVDRMFVTAAPGDEFAPGVEPHSDFEIEAFYKELDLFESVGWRHSRHIQVRLPSPRSPITLHAAAGAANDDKRRHSAARAEYESPVLKQAAWNSGPQGSGRIRPGTPQRDELGPCRNR